MNPNLIPRPTKHRLQITCASIFELSSEPLSMFVYWNILFSFFSCHVKTQMYWHSWQKFFPEDVRNLSKVSEFTVDDNAVNYVSIQLMEFLINSCVCFKCLIFLHGFQFNQIAFLRFHLFSSNGWWWGGIWHYAVGQEGVWYWHKYKCLLLLLLLLLFIIIYCGNE